MLQDSTHRDSQKGAIKVSLQNVILWPSYEPVHCLHVHVFGMFVHLEIVWIELVIFFQNCPVYAHSLCMDFVSHVCKHFIRWGGMQHYTVWILMYRDPVSDVRRNRLSRKRPDAEK